MDGPLQHTGAGLLLHVTAFPKARRNEIAGVRNGRLMVRVTAAPEDGRANAAIIKLLVQATGLPSSAIELVHGATSREKSFQLVGLSIDAARAAFNL